MRLYELLENPSVETEFEHELETMIATYLARAEAQGKDEIPTNELITYLHNMGREVSIDQLRDIEADMGNSFDITDDAISLMPEDPVSDNAEEYRADAEADERTVDHLAKKQLDKEF